MSDDPAVQHGVPVQLRIGAALVGVEALALAVLAVILLVKTITGHPHSLAAALLGAAMALLGAAVLALCGRGLLQARSSARTPVVVLQVIALPVSYTLGIQAGLLGYGAPILVIALVTLYLLFTPPVRAVLDQERDHF